MLTVLLLVAAYGALFLAAQAVSARRARAAARRAQTIRQLALVTEAGSRQRHPSSR